MRILVDRFIYQGFALRQGDTPYLIRPDARILRDQDEKRSLPLCTRVRLAETPSIPRHKRLICLKVSVEDRVPRDAYVRDARCASLSTARSSARLRGMWLSVHGCSGYHRALCDAFTAALDIARRDDDLA